MLRISFIGYYSILYYNLLYYTQFTRLYDNRLYYTSLQAQKNLPRTGHHPGPRARQRKHRGPGAAQPRRESLPDLWQSMVQERRIEFGILK